MCALRRVMTLRVSEDMVLAAGVDMRKGWGDGYRGVVVTAVHVRLAMSDSMTTN